MIQLLFRGRSRLCKTFGIRCFLAWRDCFQCIDRLRHWQCFSGYFASGLGRRNSLRLAALLFFLSALGSYYPEFLFFSKGDTSFALILAFNFYRIIGGIGVGLASAVCPMYIAEIAPSEIRGKLVSCNQFAIILACW